MGKVIGPPIKKGDQEWILKQELFFHATAPLSSTGHVNVSPKCAREFRIINDHTVAWLDLTGSGSETCAHLLENGRLTIMFVALNGGPRIMRLHGTGRTIPAREFGAETHCEILAAFVDYLSGDNEKSFGIRAIVVLDVHRVSQSCGYSIPKYDFVTHRTTLDDVTAEKGCDGMKEYRKLKNSFSIDGLPSIAQLQLEPTGTAPTAVEWKDGYLYATEYGASWWRQFCVRATVSWHYRSSWWSWRDAALLGCGAVIGAVAMRLVDKRSS